MERDWNNLTEAQRAEFTVWQEQQREAAVAKARADAAAAGRPKRYDDMTDAERREFARKNGIAVRFNSRTSRVEV